MRKKLLHLIELQPPWCLNTCLCRHLARWAAHIFILGTALFRMLLAVPHFKPPLIFPIPQHEPYVFEFVRFNSGLKDA
jgi:hypothetical protein